MINQRLVRDESGAILYDESRTSTFSSKYFDPQYWLDDDLVEGEAVGRGSTLIVRMQDEYWVLRHYLRGGLFSKVVNDSYWWSGERRTRCFREWRLLADLETLGLPVPKPVAARYVKKGNRYTADIITERIPNVSTLASALRLAPIGEDTWIHVGSCVRRFHEAGVYHADLNANNIMIGDDGSQIYIIDFDRGGFRPGQTWKQTNLDRLKRSLVKVTKTKDIPFSGREWEQLMSGYNQLNTDPSNS